MAPTLTDAALIERAWEARAAGYASYNHFCVEALGMHPEHVRKITSGERRLRAVQQRQCRLLAGLEAWPRRGRPRKKEVAA